MGQIVEKIEPPSDLVVAFMAIRDGATAAQRYLQVTFGNASVEERERVWADLKEFCGLDTRTMLELVRQCSV